MDRVRRLGAAALAAVACLVVTAQPGAAEWFADVYAGAALTRPHDVRADDRSTGIALYRDVEFDTGLAYGLRFGKYLESVPFIGFGLDAYNFSSSIGPQTVQVDGCAPSGGCGTNQIGFGSYDLGTSALSLDLFLRLPLWRSADAPGGRVQPYVLGGAPVFLTTLTPRHTRLFRNHDGDTDITLGYKGGAGLAVYVFKNLMIFGEYRFTHTSPEYEIRGASASRATVETDLDTHAGVAGLSARW
jgi:opacity protein-like surface antigen